MDVEMEIGLIMRYGEGGKAPFHELDVLVVPTLVSNGWGALIEAVWVKEGGMDELGESTDMSSGGSPPEAESLSMPIPSSCMLVLFA